MGKYDKILEFLINSTNGLTVIDAYRLFHTTELRKAVSEFRKRGLPVMDQWEDGVDKFGGKTRYKRYFYDHSSTGSA